MYVCYIDKMIMIYLPYKGDVCIKSMYVKYIHVAFLANNVTNFITIVSNVFHLSKTLLMSTNSCIWMLIKILLVMTDNLNINKNSKLY